MDSVRDNLHPRKYNFFSIMGNEKGKTIITLDDLYKSLKLYDEWLLEHFCDENLSDRDYLFCAINNDITSNGLSLLTNVLYNNHESIGVDQCCRTIIESFVILRMMEKEGVISDLQAKVFRYQYALVDKDNFRGKISEEDRETPIYKRLLQDSNTAMDALSELYGIPKKQLKGKKGLDDPNIYLKRKPEDSISFAHLLKEYPVFGEASNRIYEFFSLFAHPRFEMKPELEKAFFDIRQKHIGVILDYLIKYLAAIKRLIKDDEVPGFNEDFVNNPILVNNRNNILQVDMAFRIVASQTCFFEEGWDAYSFMYLGQLKGLVIDMMIVESLGYREQIIGKFKPFLEYASVYSVLGSIQDLEEFKTRKMAFCLSSRLQIIEHLKAMGLVDNEAYLPQVRDIYKSFYRKEYGDTFESFYNELSKNSLYFLRKEGKKSYNIVVKEAIAKVIPEKDRELVFFLYKLAKDMSHASGYNFNSSVGLVDYYCRVVMYSVWKIVIEYFMSAALTLEEHGVKTDLDPIIDAFQLFMKVEADEAKKELKKAEIVSV